MKALHEYLRIVLRHIIIWTIAFSLFNFIREFGHQIERAFSLIDQFSFGERIIFQLLVGIVSGAIFGTYEYYFGKWAARKISFGKTVLLGGIGYAVVIVTVLYAVFGAFVELFQADFGWEALNEYISSGEAVPLILYCFIVGFLIDFVRQVDKKFGPGNLVKMLTGKFYEPKEEERIFMFLDMRSSTTIAEKLGHIKYSRLIQDCFKDIDAVVPFKAEIYQYVGDEAVLTWEKDKGLEDANCVRAFFAFAARLQQRSAYYQASYGLVPEFKAGINLGKVTVAEVGEVKREIAYHGDTLNTAARIQAKCNDFERKLLASQQIVELTSRADYFHSREEGEVILRGKTEKVKIYSIELHNVHIDKISNSSE